MNAARAEIGEVGTTTTQSPCCGTAIQLLTGDASRWTYTCFSSRHERHLRPRYVITLDADGTPVWNETWPARTVAHV